MKAVFLIKAKETDIITEKGIRAFVMDRLLNSGFEKGSAANLDDKTVQVQIEGDEKGIRKFKEQLEKEVTAKFGNPVIAFTDIQETGSDIPNLMRSSQALVVGQLQKGIDVQLKILESLNSMNRELTGTINGMNKELAETIHDMNKDLKQELKALPQEIAKALNKC